MDFTPGLTLTNAITAKHAVRGFMMMTLTEDITEDRDALTAEVQQILAGLEEVMHAFERDAPDAAVGDELRNVWRALQEASLALGRAYPAPVTDTP